MSREEPALLLGHTEGSGEDDPHGLGVNVSRFDFNQVGNNIPKVDLPDLERFLRMELERQGKRPMKREEGLEVIAPEEWSKSDYAISKRYTFCHRAGGKRRAHQSAAF